MFHRLPAPRGSARSPRGCDPDAPFAVLMMTASRNQARELRSSITSAFDRLQLGAGNGSKDSLRLKVGVGSFKPGMKSMEDLVAQAGVLGEVAAHATEVWGRGEFWVLHAQQPPGGVLG